MKAQEKKINVNVNIKIMRKEKLTPELIEALRGEVYRFTDKLDAAHQRLIELNKDKPCWSRSTKEAAALRRSALDLKNELTRITQSRTY